MDLSICLKALGDPTRFSIFQKLLERRHCTRSLAGEMEISEAAVSQHLKILREAGLVYREKYGYHTHYIPSPEGMDLLASSFEEMRRAARRVTEEDLLCRCDSQKEAAVLQSPEVPEKAEGILRIALPAEGGQIFPRFGAAGQFALYDIRDGRVCASRTVGTGGIGGGALAGFLARQKTDVLICMGIGAWAADTVKKSGIRLCAGCGGPADRAVQELLAGTLEYTSDPVSPGRPGRTKA